MNLDFFFSFSQFFASFITFNFFLSSLRICFSILYALDTGVISTITASSSIFINEIYMFPPLRLTDLVPRATREFFFSSSFFGGTFEALAILFSPWSPESI